MIELLTSSVVSGYLTGAFFVLGVVTTFYLLGRFFPSLRPGGSSSADSGNREGRKVTLACFERRGAKVFVRIENASSIRFDQFMFRVVVRDPNHKLIADISTWAKCPIEAGSADECLLTIHDEAEQAIAIDPANTIGVQLIQSIEYQ
jgi:hypothetical protein